MATLHGSDDTELNCHPPTESTQLFIPEFLDDTPENLSEEQKRHQRILKRRYNLLKKRQKIVKEVNIISKNQDEETNNASSHVVLQSKSSSNIGIEVDPDFKNLNTRHRWNTNTSIFQRDEKTENNDVQLVPNIDSEIHKTEVSLQFLDQKPEEKQKEAKIIVQKGQSKFCFS